MLGTPLRFAVPILAAVALTGCGVSSITGGGCPYGKSDESTDGTGCAPRPEPTQAERAAATDGSALKNALAAFKKHEDGGKSLTGVGVSRWGDTTFAVSTGKASIGEQEKWRTFDRTGKLAPEKKGFVRGYEMVESTTFAAPIFAVTDVKPQGLAKGIRQVLKGAPKATFYGAALVAPPAGGLQWTLRFARSPQEKVGAMILKMSPDGGLLCSMGKISAVKGIPDCKEVAQGTAPATPSNPSEPSLPVEVPTIDTSEITKATEDIQKDVAKQLECVQKAGTDAVAIQKCVE